MAGKNEIGKISITLQLSTEKLQAGIRTAEKELKKFGRVAQQAGSMASVAFAAGLGSLGVKAVKSFGSFDAAIRRSMAYLDDAGDIGGAAYNKLIDGAKKLSETTSFTATEAAEAYGVLGQAGLNAAEAFEALPIFADFATAGNMKLAESGEMLIQIQQSLGEEFKTAAERAENFKKISDVIGQASLDTTLSIQDLSTSLASQLGGALRQAGVKIETATAILEAFGAQGIKGAKAGTALGIVIRDLGLKYIKNFKVFQEAGINVFDDQGNFKNIIGVIKEMEKALDGLSDIDKIAKLQKLGFTLKNISFIQSLMGMGDAMSEFEQKNEKASGSIAALAAKIREGFLEQMQMAFNIITNSAIVLGAEFAPAVLAVTRGIADFSKWFTTLSPEVKGFTAIVIGLTVVLTVLGTTVGVVSLAIGNLLALFNVLGGATVVKGLLVLKATFVSVGATIVGTIGLIPTIVIGTIAVVTGLFLGFGDQISEIFESIGSYIWETFKSIAPETATVIEGVYLLISDYTTAFFEFWAKAFDLAKTIYSAFFEGLKDIAEKTWAFVTEQANNFFNAFEKKFPLLGGIARDVFDGIAKAFKVLDDIIASSKTFLLLGGGSNSLGDAIAKKLGADKLDENFNAGLKKIGEAFGAIGDAAKDRVHEERTKELAAQTEALEKQVNLSNKLKEINKDILGLANQDLSSGALEMLPGVSGVGPGIPLGDLNKQREEVEKIKQASKETGFSVEQIQTALKNGKRSLAETLKEFEANSEEANKMAKATAKAAKEAEKWQSKWKEFNAGENAKALQKNIDDIFSHAELSGEDLINLDKLTQELRKSVEQGFFEEWKEGLKHGLKLEDIQMGMKAAGNAAVDEVGEKVDGKIDEMNAKINQGLVDAGQGFINLIGVAGDAFGVDLSGLVSALGELSPESKEKIGKGIQSGVQDLFGKDFMESLGWSGEDMDAATKEMMDDIEAGFNVASDIFSASDKDKATKSNAGTGAAAGGAIGAYFGGSVGQKIGSQLGSLVGGMFKWGSQDPDTQARHAFANFVEEGFQKLKTVAFFDKDKKLQLTKGDKFNFLEGSNDRFNLPGWADEFNKLDPVIKNTFDGLGKALKETLGLTEDVGSQIAFLLSENLGANVDNARLFVAQLGLSIEDLSNSLIAAGETGAMTWLEVESGLQGLGEAFKPGLAATGDILGAWQQLTDSGGRGIAAIKAVQNIAVETLEAGGKTLKDLEAKMLAAGIPAEEVSALMAALSQRQITTLEQLAEVSNRVGGGIVADINAGSQSMADNWAKMTEQLEDVSKKLKEIPDEVTSNIKLNVSADMSDEVKQLLNSGVTGVDIPEGTQKFAKGGLLTRKMAFGMAGGFGLAGEAGPEFIMPATRLPDGSMGIRAVGQGHAKGYPVINLTVNAPNSAPGMEHKIVNALDRVRKDMISQTIDIISRQQGRY